MTTLQQKYQDMRGQDRSRATVIVALANGSLS